MWQKTVSWTLSLKASQILWHAAQFPFDHSADSGESSCGGELLFPSTNSQVWSKTSSMFADQHIQFLCPSSLVMARAAFSMAASDIVVVALDMVFFRARSRTAGLAGSESFSAFQAKDSVSQVYSVQR